MSRRRTRRNARTDAVSEPTTPDQATQVAQADRMDAVREQAGDYTASAPIPDEDLDELAAVDAKAHEDADEIADGMAALEDEGPGDGPDLDVIENGMRAAAEAAEAYDPTAGEPGVIEQLGELDPQRPVGWSEVSVFDPEPPFDPEIFERGPLAAGIRMLEALLTQAKAGYIDEQIRELARVLDVDFPDPERYFLGQVAAQETTASGLPDVAGAYQALVRAKAQVA